MTNLFGKSIRQLLLSDSKAVGLSATVCGWVRSARTLKNHVFIEICDGSSLKPLQAVADASEMPRISTGAAVKVTGNIVNSPGKNQGIEIRVNDLKVVGDCPPQSYPLAKAKLPIDFLREKLNFRSRSKTFGAVWRLRDALIREIHLFFKESEFLLVQTPIITSSDCEGAGEIFQLKDEKFFGNPAFLTVSGQLQLEVMNSAHSRVYTLNPAFRAEKSSTSRHLAEFWMLEAEVAFINDLSKLTEFIEALLKQTSQKLLENNSQDLEFLNKWIDPSLLTRIESLVEKPFTSISYTEAINLLSSKQFEFPVKWGLDLQSEHEKYLSNHFNGPVFVTDYPAEIKPFYMKQQGDTVASFDLLIPKIGELVGGSLREDCALKLAASMQKHSIKDQDWYLDLRRFGGAPHGGFGLGLERLLRYLTGMRNVKDVIYFPNVAK